MKPMEAYTLNSVDDVIFPVLASPKFDGVRAVIKDGIVYSKRLKPIPNRFVQKRFGQYKGFDGELILGDPTDKDCFNKTHSAVMSVEGEPDIHLYVYDTWDRILQLSYSPIAESPYVISVQHKIIHYPSDLLKYVESCIDMGYEGAMTRSLFGKYLFGRAGKTGQELLKWKKPGLSDSEAVVIGVVEQMQNTNPPVLQPNGRMKRSTKKEGMVGKDTLGSIIAKDIHTGVEFSVGSGLSDEMRALCWRHSILGRVFTYTFQGIVKEKPRFPVFKGWRDEIDI